MSRIGMPLTFSQQQIDELLTTVSEIVNTKSSKDYYTTLRDQIAVRYYFDKKQNQDTAIYNANIFVQRLKDIPYD